MTKTEFLDKLKIALNGNVSDSLLRENMTYYNEYIDSQISLGESEQEVMERLGDPRLIARTIVQTNGIHEDAFGENDSDNAFYGENDYEQGGYYGGRNEVKVRTLPGWLWAVLIVLVIVCLISLAFKVVALLLPLLVPALIIIFFIKLFRDWLN